MSRLLELDDPSDPDQVARTVSLGQTLGPGQLAYLPEGSKPPTVDIDAYVEVVDVAAIRDWVVSLPQDDVAESSIEDMAQVLVLRLAGKIAGAAGHIDWPADIAHIGILVDPAFRGNGNGVLLGAAATQRAIAGDRYPQWRAAAWNGASRAIARSIGYEEFGRQFSFQVD